jgi:hypothetical protein
MSVCGEGGKGVLLQSMLVPVLAALQIKFDAVVPTGVAVS